MPRRGNLNPNSELSRAGITSVPRLSLPGGQTSLAGQQIKCRACEETFFVRMSSGTILPPEPILRKAQLAGWSTSMRGTHTCPNCKRKATLAQALALPEIAALVDAARHVHSLDEDKDEAIVNLRHLRAFRAALAEVMP